MKYILLTGAYGGMGRAVTRALADSGYFVFALDKNVGDAEDNVMPIKADLTRSEDVDAALAQIREHTDSLFAVLHFAGIYMLDSLVEMSEESFAKIFNINLFGVYRVTRAAMPLLGRGSRIVITTSELAPLDPLPFTGIYAVTKSALDKYAYSLRMELQLLGIKVSVLRPGAVSTDMLGVSTSALDRFCERTEMYACNAKRFKKIVESVEARSISPEKVARRTLRILRAKSPRYVYSINRNPLLLMLAMLPKRLQTAIIKLVLK